MKTKPFLLIESGTLDMDKRSKTYGTMIDIPMGRNSTVVLNGDDISSVVSYIHFEVHATSVASWIIGLTTDSRLTKLNKRFHYLKCRLIRKLGIKRWWK